MKDYVIITDSTADLPKNIIEELAIQVIPMSFGFDNESYLDYPDYRNLDIHKFYEKIKVGQRSTTTLINSMTFTEYFEPILKNGYDVLYMGFSSGLSGTFNASLIAAEQLMEKYEGSKIICADTLSATLGEGMLVYTAVKKKAEGLNIDELNLWIINNRLNLCHWFTVDDINHLKRGGRISAVAATVGTVLNVKPILHVNNEGKLVAVNSVRGRKKSIHALFEKMIETCINPEEQIIFISHGDVIEDAEYLGNLIKERLHVKDVVINYIGPVIGSHTGYGALTLFFFGTER